MQPLLFPSGPWRRIDRVQLWTGSILSTALIVAAWIGAARQADVERQVVWAAAGVAGVLVLYGTAIGWLIRARRAAGVRRRQLLGSGPGRGVGLPGLVTDDLIAVEGLRRYHRPTCALISGRATVAATASSHQAAGRQACQVCL